MSKPSVIPELGPRCNSWVCTSPRGNTYEFWSRKNVEKAANKGWLIETSAQYLTRINADLRGNESFP